VRKASDTDLCRVENAFIPSLFVPGASEISDYDLFQFPEFSNPSRRSDHLEDLSERRMKSNPRSKLGKFGRRPKTFECGFLSFRVSQWIPIGAAAAGIAV
jgi:hypothetical protein